ncbi:uncharacterized protein [Watersipora subatra]|uniref:uncharacterized protein n=1 Tax=Watersipora subatra TaxID=2589382 RepID=UPI00355B974C
MAGSGIDSVKGSLSLPTVKALAYHLKSAVPSATSSNRKYWSCSYNKKPTYFCLVWVQGVIVNVDTDEEEVVIRDESGKMRLVEAKINTATIDDLYVLKPGQYVMAVGELISNDSLPVLLTHKLKVMESGREVLAALWPLEVQHQLKYAPVKY